jgi:hypothetical protein
VQFKNSNKRIIVFILKIKLAQSCNPSILTFSKHYLCKVYKSHWPPLFELYLWLTPHFQQMADHILKNNTAKNKRLWHSWRWLIVGIYGEGIRKKLALVCFGVHLANCGSFWSLSRAAKQVESLEVEIPGLCYLFVWHLFFVDHLGRSVHIKAGV